jgi:hypothetical protein
MPYSGASDTSLPEHVKKMSAGMRAQWVEVFNSSMKAGHDEGTAMAMANGVANKRKEAEYDPVTGVIIWADGAPTIKQKLWYNEEEPITQAVESEMSTVKKALQSIAKALGVGDTTKEVVLKANNNNILFVKTSDGALRFFTSFTNCFKDLQGEVITQAAHKDYVFWATNKEQYPDLWLWHSGPQSKFGKVDWLDYSDGFVLASGVIDADKEHIAAAIEKEVVKVSHGFYGVSNVAKEIVAYRTFEISILPAANAANPYTSFNIAKDTQMPFSPTKKAWLKTVANMTDEAITTWETNLASMSESLKALGIEYKETIEDSIGAEVANYAKVLLALVESVKSLSDQVKVQSVATTELEAKLAAGVASQVESAILAKIAQAPTGFTATQSKDNIVAKEKAENDFSWFAALVSK